MVVTLTGNNEARCRRRVGLLRGFHVGRYGPFRRKMPRKCLFSSARGGGGGKLFIIVFDSSSEMKGWRGRMYRNVIKINRFIGSLEQSEIRKINLYFPSLRTGSVTTRVMCNTHARTRGIGNIPLLYF